MPRFQPAVVLCALLFAPPCPAHPFVEHLEPPVLQRGKSSRLTAVGTDLTRPVGLWCTLPSGKIDAKPERENKPNRATFDVRVAADAPVGLFGLRVATADGLSNVHLFLIDDLPVRLAPEPDKIPARVELPCALWGRFREGERDRFAIDVKAGQVVSFEAVGNRFGKEVDPLVTIRDARDHFISERDNDVGLFFDCRFAHRFAAAGPYTVEVRDSRYQGHDHGYWVLRMGRFPAARVAVPAVVRPGKIAQLFLPELSETLTAGVPAAQHSGSHSLSLKRPGDEGSTWLPVEVDNAEAFIASTDAVTARSGTLAKVPGHLYGVLTKPGERQFFRLKLEKGQTIHAMGHGRWLNSPIDMELSLTDETGRLLRRANENADETIRLDFTAGNPGVYCLAVRDASRSAGPACAYRLEVRSEPPPPAVVAEVEGLIVPRNSYQPIPLTVTRNGYAGPIALSLTGAPPGVAMTPTDIPPGVDSLVCKLAAGAGSPLGLHTLQLWAEPTNARTSRKALVRTRPMIDRQLLNVDLIAYSLREDQLRLPPSVADRLALQVTEEAPFSFELVEPTVTLPRYQHAPIPIISTRKPGFDAAISFTARGGQLADKAEGRTRVYAEFPQATARSLKVSGGVHSRILANIGRTRIEVLGSAQYAGRTITLTRTFNLEIRTAFTVAPDGTAPVKLVPGHSKRVKIKVERLPTFTGTVRVALSEAGGLVFAETVTIPRGQQSIEIEVKAVADASPGRRSILLTATADVDGFEEEHRGARIEIEVSRPEVPKKK
jgi:hypothetical protein